MAQIIDLQCNGLKTHPNPLLLPPGSLIRAINTVCDKPNVIESARGSKLFGPQLSSSPNKLFGYQGQIIVQYDTKLGFYASDGSTETDYAGSFSPPAGWRMKSIQANRNFYFTTTLGVYKLDSITGTPGPSGGIKALDGTAVTTGASGFLANNTAVAYRIVWGIKDANGNLILGAPSQRIIASNTSGGTRNVSLTFTIPSGITVNHIYQVYRSGQPPATTPIIEPNDELQEVFEANPTSGQIAALSITLTDSIPDELRGVTIYTAPSQQGILQANEAPPLCKDCTVFRGMAMYANTISKQRFFLNLISVNTPNLFYYSQTGDTHTGGTANTITNVASVTGLAVGQLITDTGGKIPANTHITAITGAGPFTITMDQNATGAQVGDTFTFRDVIKIKGVEFYADSTENVANRFFLITTSGTVGQNVAATAQSLIRVMNQQTSPTIYGYYVSAYSDLPGKMLFEDVSLGGSTWNITSSKGSSFSPALPTTGTSISSSADTRKNGICVSKINEPESVPLVNFYTAGSADQDILRIVALRDSVFVLKKDGVFRITGTSPTDLQVSLFDNTANVRGEDAAGVVNNQIFAMTNQGVVSISDSGVQVLSRDIEKDIVKLFSDLYPNADTATFGFGYETERKYWLWTVTNVGDTYATQAFVYNTFTSTWTTWMQSYMTGFVDPFSDKMFLGMPSPDNRTRIERKTFTVEDYAMNEYPVTITAFSGTNVTVNSTASAIVGQTLAQAVSSSYLQAVVTKIVDGTNLTVDRITSWNIAAAKLYDPLPVTIEWYPIHAGNPGVIKHFQEVTMFFREARFKQLPLYFASNFTVNGNPSSLVPTSTGAWGAGAWGGFPWGGGPPSVQPIRTYVTPEQARAHWINMSVINSEALTLLAISGFSVIYEINSPRVK